jgi:hypothetical protein
MVADLFEVSLVAKDDIVAVWMRGRLSEVELLHKRLVVDLLLGRIVPSEQCADLRLGKTELAVLECFQDLRAR